MDADGNSLAGTDPSCKDISASRGMGSQHDDGDDDVDSYPSEELGRWARLCSCKELDTSNWSKGRKLAASIVESKPSEMIMGALILFNVILLVIEVDRTAACKAVQTEPCDASPVLKSLNTLLLGVYTVEIAVRFYAYRCWFFLVPWNLLDGFIVLTGLFDLIMSYHDTRGLPNLQMFRMFRLFKLLRTVRLLVFFPELYELVRGFAGALKAMLWGAFIIFVMLGVWSLMALEVVPSPLEFEDGELASRCEQALGGVYPAILLLFQTLVAGDAWGQCAIPIMDRSPLSVVIFVGSLVSVQLGITNLILAVIVDAAAGAREKDHEARLREKRRHEQRSLEHWRTIVESLDVDCSGTISLEELMTGFQTQPEVMKCFQLLDVDHGDLESFFLLMDCDESGDLSYKEFFHTLRKAHSQDLRMYLMNVKLQISRISHLLSKQMAAMAQGFQSLSAETAAAMAASATAHTHRPSPLSGAAEQLRAVFSPEPVKKPQAVLVDSSFAKSEHERLNQLYARFDEKLEKLTQDADANAALLVHNTKMLEALLASCGLGETGEMVKKASSVPSRAASKGSLRPRCESSADPSSFARTSTQGVTQAVGACPPWTRNGRSPVAGDRLDSSRGHRLLPRTNMDRRECPIEDMVSV